MDHAVATLCQAHQVLFLIPRHVPISTAADHWRFCSIPLTRKRKTRKAAMSEVCRPSPPANHGTLVCQAAPTTPPSFEKRASQTRKGHNKRRIASQVACKGSAHRPMLLRACLYFWYLTEKLVSQVRAHWPATGPETPQANGNSFIRLKTND